MEEFGDSLNPSVLLLSDWWAYWHFLLWQNKMEKAWSNSETLGSAPRTTRPSLWRWWSLALTSLDEEMLLRWFARRRRRRSLPRYHFADGVSFDSWQTLRKVLMMFGISFAFCKGVHQLPMGPPGGGDKSSPVSWGGHHRIPYNPGYMGFKHFLEPSLLCSKYFETRPDYLVGWTSVKWEGATLSTLGSTRFRSGFLWMQMWKIFSN